MKKIAIFIPIKCNSTRVPNKNFSDLGGVPLYIHAFTTAKAIVDNYNGTDVSLTVVVDTDSDKVKSDASLFGLNVLDRDPKLAEDTANGDSLLKHHISIFQNFDIYCQLYITCPFQNPESIIKLLDSVMESGENDSGFLAYEKQTWYWYGGKPVNYTIGNFPRSQDSIPVIMETTGFYCVTKSAWKKTKSRIGLNPIIRNVSFKEAVDIDNIEDLELARILCDVEL